MNRFVKMSVAAAALSFSVSAFAADASAIFRGNREEVIGWTPFCLGLATPVQLPWGANTWDVYGINVGLLFVDAPKMYGLEVAGLASITRDKMIGLQVSGLANYSLTDVYGMRVSLGINACATDVYGADIGAFGLRENLYGLDVQFLGCFERKLVGCGIAGLLMVNADEMTGATIALGGSVADIVNGCQISGLYNHAQELHGCQIGLVNYTDDCQNGFQLGLVNIIRSNCVPFLPIVNGCF